MDMHEKIRELTKGESKAEIARRAGLSVSAISNILNTGAVPNAKKALHLARALGVSVDWLADDEQGWPPVSSGEGVIDQLESMVSPDIWDRFTNLREAPAGMLFLLGSAITTLVWVRHADVYLEGVDEEKTEAVKGLSLLPFMAFAVQQLARAGQGDLANRLIHEQFAEAQRIFDKEQAVEHSSEPRHPLRQAARRKPDQPKGEDQGEDTK